MQPKFRRGHYLSDRLSVLLAMLLFLLVGCGSGSDSAPSVALPSPDVEQNEPEACVDLVHPIISASDEGNYEEGYSPQHTIDNNTHPESRWSNTGVDRALTLDLGADKVIGALTIKWFKGSERVANFSVETSQDKDNWTPVLAPSESSGKHSGFELVSVEESQARYIKVIGLGNSEDTNNGIIEINAHRCEDANGEFADLLPNEVGIELIDWYLSVPSDEDSSGTSDSISASALANGYSNSEYFYASSDNGIVMRSPSYGFKTSTNTNYVRVELREMLRRGDRSISTQGVNKNNWVFGSASSENQTSAGGVDGDLRVTLAVNHVTTTGESYQVGRLIIGQIHANDDEPVRLYYRKLPENELGSVYFAHESRVEDNEGDNIETYVELIGSRSNSASNPIDGIALDEKFSYHISVNVNLLTVTISREGQADITAHYDMSESRYDEDNQYHYFKVGVYHVNNSSDPDEFAQATFYDIKNSHTGYNHSE